jgi:hypothetical protein
MYIIISFFFSIRRSIPTTMRFNTRGTRFKPGRLHGRVPKVSVSHMVPGATYSTAFNGALNMLSRVFYWNNIAVRAARTLHFIIRPLQR